MAHDVLIIDDFIAALGQGLDAGDDRVVISGNGVTVMPGLRNL
jgi:imidazolonepropionase-like amidohydrolase